MAGAMNDATRRGFTASLLALPLLGRPARLPIRSLEWIRCQGQWDTEANVNRQHQVTPLHVYEALRPAEYKDGAATPTKASVSALYLKINSEEGLAGLYGPIDREAAIVVDAQLKPFLAGKDALAGEALWDQMHRLNRHSRSSHYMMAISAVDNALWDLRGRYFEAPVYRLLGGPTRQAVTCYGSALGSSVEPDKIAPRARALKAAGFHHQKWFLAYGPGNGAAGLAKNVNLVKTLRESLGNDTDLMFDAFMGWDLNYALQWAKQVESYRPRWIEEAFHVDKLESFAALRRATSIPVATGEHFYGRWEVERYLRAEAIHVCQSDPEWCGGVSELVKMAHLCSAADVHLIPHGHSIHAALHVVASQSPMTCPLVEYLVLKMRNYYWFEKNPPAPVDGKVALPDRPGFGIELDPARATKMETLTALA
jgi:L-alanine-DL-glutamate epimerase-like enolase superfamily enzyme